MQNTKNATDRAYDTQKILADAGLNKGVALSVQTLSADALKNIRRDNISLETYLELQRRFARVHVETFSDMILGLPGETVESFIDGIDQLLESGQHNRIQFNNCAILPNAEMAAPEYVEKFHIETTSTEIINIHGTRELLEDDVPEMQELVVSTYSMTRDEWRLCRAYAWLTALLHFDKILQIPIILLHHLTETRYRAVFEAFMDADAERHPMIAGIRDFFIAEAASIQAGGSEYTHSAEWLGIYWPADEYVFIKMTQEKTLDTFYGEAESLLLELAAEANAPDEVTQAIKDAIRVNRALLHQPFIIDDVEFALDFNVMDVYKGVVEGSFVPLKRQKSTILINRSLRSYSNFQTWCREIVWWGNKKGAYLYSNTSANKELAGHH